MKFYIIKAMTQKRKHHYIVGTKDCFIIIRAYVSLESCLSKGKRISSKMYVFDLGDDEIKCFYAIAKFFTRPFIYDTNSLSAYLVYHLIMNHNIRLIMEFLKLPEIGYEYFNAFFKGLSDSLSLRVLRDLTLKDIERIRKVLESLAISDMLVISMKFDFLPKSVDKLLMFFDIQRDPNGAWVKTHEFVPSVEVSKEIIERLAYDVLIPRAYIKSIRPWKYYVWFLNQIKQLPIEKRTIAMMLALLFSDEIRDRKGRNLELYNRIIEYAKGASSPFEVMLKIKYAVEKQKNIFDILKMDFNSLVIKLL